MSQREPGPTPGAPGGESATLVYQRAQLWFEQFRDIAVMALSLAGGALTLLGTIFSDAPRRAGAFVSILFFATAAVTALYAQSYVVDLADRGRGPGRGIRRARLAAYALVAAGLSAFLTFSFTALTRR